MTPLYTTQASASGGREGTAATPDGRLSVKLSTPKELGGGGADGTNPEQLFAAGYAACFLGAIKFVAGESKIDVPADTKVETSVGIGKREDGTGFGLAVTIKASLPGLSKEQAEDLVQRAHVVCPYSHATKGNITVAVSAA